MQMYLHKVVSNEQKNFPAGQEPHQNVMDPEHGFYLELSREALKALVSIWIHIHFASMW